MGENMWGAIHKGVCWRVISLSIFISSCTALPAQKAEYARKPLADVFSEHSVIQANAPIAVWGTALPDDKVVVEIGNERRQTQAAADGRWAIELPAMKPGGPFDMVVSVNGKYQQTVGDILIGDVWLCSGQSNMEMPVRLAANADREIEDAFYPDIRLLKIERTDRASPQENLPKTALWVPVTPEAVPDFSAVCYYFARELAEAHKVPVGVIDASWGGSIAQAWTSAQSIRALGGYDEKLDLNELYVTAPTLAERAWEAHVNNWWKRNDMGTSSIPAWFEPKASTHWPTISVPQEWENAGIDVLAKFDGVVWFQHDFNLTAAQAAEGVAVSLGPIDDWDTTWINGKLVGQTQGWRTSRDYVLDRDVLRSGQNTIAIRVLDGGNGGGFRARPGEMIIQMKTGEPISLAGQWRYAVSKELSDMEPLPEKPWRHAHGVSNLYNGMIAPLAPYSMRGVVWYQGESDRKWPDVYRRLLPSLISDWRMRFDMPTLPFIIVQLTSFGAANSAPEYSAFAEIREVQRLTALKDPHASLAITIDVGDRYDIHPTNKQAVGRRAFIAADRLIYGAVGDPCDRGPESSLSIDSDIVVEFPAGCTLSKLEAESVLGFQICASANQCHFTNASLEGNLVRVDASSGSSTKLVRYCWSDSPICNLVQREKLPVAPFQLQVSSANGQR